MKVAACCIIKLENNYIREWCQHYKQIGCDDIFIYDNNDINSESPNEILKDLNYVHIINARGKKAYQILAYNDCISKHQTEYDYICFFDADEFLEIKNNMNIKEYLSLPFISKYDAIQINCYNMNDNNLLGNENNCNRSINRFKQHYSKYNTEMCKTIIKMGKNIKMINACQCTTTINCGDNKGDIHKPVCSCKPDYTYAKLKHYRKTIIEFLESKYKKTWADSLASDTPQFEWYWKYSGSIKTPAKLKIIDTFLKTGKIDYTITND